MIDSNIIEKLSVITPEEEKILSGAENIDRRLYMMEKGNVINSKKLLDEGKLITIRPHTRFINFPRHSHDYIEVVYMCKGKSTHIINGKKIELRAGELLFIGKNTAHEILITDKDDIGVNFIILPQFFDAPLKMLGNDETPLRRFVLTFLENKDDSSGYLHFKVGDVLPVQNLIENLLYTLIHDTPNKRMINQTTFGLLMLQLLNNTDTLSYGKDSDALAVKVYRYVEENYCKGSLLELASLLSRDFFGLSREIKKQTGKTYTEIVREKRLSQAAFLLKNTNLRISDISVAVGYENESYFYRIFTKEFGQTPKKFRDCK